jgi:hypothetical protein
MDPSESWYDKAEEFFEEVEKIVRRYEFEEINSETAMMEIGFAVALMTMKNMEDN